LSETRTRILHWFVSGGVAKTHDGAEFTIDVDALVVGRDPGAAIVLADQEVSALHCELRAVSEGILVKDLGSTNGTFLGAIRVREAIVTTPIELTVGRAKILLEPRAKHRVEVGFADRFGPLVGASPKMRRVFGVLEKVAATPLSVLIVGETGTGKELAARAIHDASDRKQGPLVIVDCGSTRRAPSRAPPSGARARSPRRMAGLSFSTSSVNCPSSYNPNSFVRSAKGR
jgi:transcriptional regulator of acetoin/glycerol metabolism